MEFRRLSGRIGPGAGRPSKLYRRADARVAVSLPPRQLRPRRPPPRRRGDPRRRGRGAAAETLRRRRHGRGRDRSGARPRREAGRWRRPRCSRSQGYEPRPATTTCWCWRTAPSTRWPRSTPTWSAGSTATSCRASPTASAPTGSPRRLDPHRSLLRQGPAALAAAHRAAAPTRHSNQPRAHRRRDRRRCGSRVPVRAVLAATADRDHPYRAVSGPARARQAAAVTTTGTTSSTGTTGSSPPRACRPSS